MPSVSRHLAVTFQYRVHPVATSLTTTHQMQLLKAQPSFQVVCFSFFAAKILIAT